MDDCIQEVLLRCMHVTSINAVQPVVTEKLTETEKNLTKILDHEMYVMIKYGFAFKRSC